MSSIPKPSQPQHSLDELAQWVISPRGWRGKYGRLIKTRLFPAILGLSLIMGLFLTTSLLYFSHPEWAPGLSVLQVILAISGLLMAAQLLYRTHRNVVTPLSDLRQWALRMRGGDYAARIPIPPRGEFAKLSSDINGFAEELQHLAEDMDARVRKQTRRLAHKSRSLEILYDVAATINASRDLDDLLNRFLYTIKDLTDARAATVRLTNSDGDLRLVTSVGLDSEVCELEAVVDIDRCLCGQSLREGRAICQKDMSYCEEFLGRPMFKTDGIEMLAVPLQYRNRDLGVYNLFLDKVGIGISSETRELLTSIGRHLGMAIEKARLDKESQRLTIIQERNMLAHELHDSLAQTIASMRFQIRILDETLESQDIPNARKELDRIKNSMDEAHTELRELLAQFRAPIDERGLFPALQGIIKRFKNETGIATFLQKECSGEDLPPLYEMQILRIIQESLVNIRKHAQAQAVRVLLRCDTQGEYLILIEDDGVGLGGKILDGNPGEHVGLSIMQERASKIGGKLRFESEPGEGTRVELTFKEPQKNMTANELVANNL